MYLVYTFSNKKTYLCNAISNSDSMTLARLRDNNFRN